MVKSYRRAQITNSKLDEAAVRRIRLRAASGVPARVMAEELGMSTESIRKIIRRETWPLVSEEGPGAEHEEWQRTLPTPAAGEVDAFMKRVAERAGISAPVPSAPQPFQSLEEALRAQALKEEAASPGLERLQAESAKLRRGDQVLEELTGHGNVAGVDCPIPATSVEPTDGGKHDQD